MMQDTLIPITDIEIGKPSLPNKNNSHQKFEVLFEEAVTFVVDSQRRLWTLANEARQQGDRRAEALLRAKLFDLGTKLLRFAQLEIGDKKAQLSQDAIPDWKSLPKPARNKLSLVFEEIEGECGPDWHRRG